MELKASFWSDPEKDRKARELWQKGERPTAIAIAVGAPSKAAVISRARRKGWGCHKSFKRTGIKDRVAKKRDEKKTVIQAVVLDQRSVAVQPELFVEPEVKDDIARSSVADIGPSMCRFVVGKPSGVEPCFCGDTTDGSSYPSYCLRHAMIVYQPRLSGGKNRVNGAQT